MGMKSRGVHPQFAPFAVFILLTVLPCLNSLAAEPAAILIKNVHLIDPEAIAEDAVVNILITDGKLDVVTRDDIAPEIG